MQYARSIAYYYSKLVRACAKCSDAQELALRASFLLKHQEAASLSKGKPPATAGRKAKGSRVSLRDSLAARVRGARTRSELLASLTSGSRAHDVGQATTPQGQPWGVCISGYKKSSTRSSPWYLPNFNNLIPPRTDAYISNGGV